MGNPSREAKPNTMYKIHMRYVRGKRAKETQPSGKKMQDEYFHRLAPDVQLLVNDIEQAAGLEVDVRVDPLRAGRGPDAAGILACDIDEYHACILIPAPEKFPDGAVV